MKHKPIPDDYEVRPIGPDDTAKDRATCGHCGLSWDDGIVTSMTPAPSARCPFEAFHVYDEDDMPRQTKAERIAALPHVVMTGNPVDGFELRGPFENSEEALQHAEETDYEKDWWIVPIHQPE